MAATQDAPVATAEGVTPTRLTSLTGLRFIAAFLVFLLHVSFVGIFSDSHAQSGYSFVTANGGSIGVCFFFVLSGFVLTWSARSTDTPRRFWRRRFFKIVPNHVVVFAASLLLMLLSATPVAAPQAIANLFLVHPLTAQPSYILDQVNGVTWTLSVELVFYLFFPLFIVLARRIRPDRLWGWAFGVGLLVTALPAILGPVLPAQPTFGPLGQSWPMLWGLDFGPPARLLEFGLGILLARIVQTGRWVRLPVPVAALIAAAGYAVSLYLPAQWTFVAPYAVPLGLLIAAVATREIKGRRSWLSSRTMVWLGEISFAFYLVHFNLLFFLHGAVSGHLTTAGTPIPLPAYGTFGAALFVVGALLAAVFLSWLLHTLVERPAMRHWARPRRRPLSMMDQYRMARDARRLPEHDTDRIAEPTNKGRTAMNECPVLDTAGRDIHGQAAYLRAQGPAVKVELPGQVHVWSVNSHAVIKEMLLDPRVTKSARNHWTDFRAGRIPPDWELISWIAMDNMVTAYGQDLRRLRKLIGSAFSPRRVQTIRPRIVELTNMILDGLASTEPGEVVDLRQRFCYPLPSLLVAELIGMDQEALARTTPVMMMMVDTTVTPEQAQAVLAGWRSAMVEFIQSKREHPGEDITSDLIAARDDETGSRLTEEELIDTIFAILGAGSETTINFFDNAITELLTHPDQLRLVLSGERTWEDVTEETLRNQAPLANLPLRYAVEDIELDGVTIPKGEPILLNFAAVGRDPALHPQCPNDFDITRADKSHLTFGLGPHYCLGAGIARSVAAIGLSTLFERYPKLSLAVSTEELQHLNSFIMNGHQALPVRLTEAAAAAA